MDTTRTPSDEKHVADALRLNQKRLQALASLGQMGTATISELCDFALDQAIRITESALGYLYFYNESTRQFTLYSWSAEAMKQCTIIEKQTVYDLDATGLWGEAIRQRTAVITNDYTAPNPSIKGTPAGHVKLTRHLNLPVFASGHIVAVIGVGNKQDPYDPTDVAQLHLLMDGTWRIIERRQAEQALKESEERLQMAVTAADLGIWDWNLRTGKIAWNENHARIYGIPLESFDGTFDGFDRCVHPDDRQPLARRIGEAIEAHAEFRNEHRVVWPDGTVRWIIGRGRCYYDPAGNPTRMTGTVMDITDQKRNEEALRESESLLRSFFDSPGIMRGIVELLDDDILHIEANSVAASFFGLSREFTRNRRASAMGVPPETLRMWIDRYNESRRTGNPVSFDYLHQTGNEKRWLCANVCFLGTSNGKPRFAFAVADDTHRRLAEMEKETSIELLRLINSSQSAAQLAQAIIPLLQQYFDCQAIGIRLRQDNDYPYIASAGFPDGFVESETHLVTPVKDCSPLATCLPDKSCLCGSVISGQADKLPQCATLHGSLRISDAVQMIEQNPQVLTWLRGRCIDAGFRSITLVPLRLGNVIMGLLQFNDPHVGRLSADQTAFAERLADKLAIAFSEFQAVEALRHSDIRYRTLFDESPVAMWESDLSAVKTHLQNLLHQGISDLPRHFQESPQAMIEALALAKPLDVNKQAIRLYAAQNKEQMFHSVVATMTNAGPIALGQCAVALVEGRTDFEIECLSQTLDNRTLAIILRWSVLPGYQQSFAKVIISAIDITAQRQAEQRLRQNEQFAITGRLAAQVAHEINNPLAGIKNSFLLLKDAIPADHRYYSYVGRIEKEVDRISRIMRQMYTLYRPQQQEPRQFNLADVIRDVAAMVQSGNDNTIPIRFEIPNEPLSVTLPEDSLRQVLFNVLRNAVEASPPDGQVTLTLCAQPHLAIHVADQGPGIPDSIGPRVFEPFFTTKGSYSAGGLGLGLSVSRSLVQAMGGTLEFRPNTPRGTLFTITLPYRSSASGT